MCEFKSLKKLRGVRVFMHLCLVVLTHPHELTVGIARPQEMMIILLLFLQKQSLGAGVSLSV
jgi:hypothetical protein